MEGLSILAVRRASVKKPSQIKSIHICARDVRARATTKSKKTQQKIWPPPLFCGGAIHNNTENQKKKKKRGN
jgi:hypothetical protein